MDRLPLWNLVGLFKVQRQCLFPLPSNNLQLLQESTPSVPLCYQGRIEASEQICALGNQIPGIGSHGEMLVSSPANFTLFFVSLFQCKVKRTAEASPGPTALSLSNPKAVVFTQLGIATVKLTDHEIFMSKCVKFWIPDQIVEHSSEITGESGDMSRRCCLASVIPRVICFRCCMKVLGIDSWGTLLVVLVTNLFCIQTPGGFPS